MFSNIKILSIVIIAAVLILITTIIPGRLNIFQKQQPGYEILDVKTFMERYKANESAVLLDVRTPEEIAKGKIEEPMQIDYNSQDFHEQLDKLDKNKEYFVYCRTSRRSGETCDYLAKKGIKCYVLKGGFEAWSEEK